MENWLIYLIMAVSGIGALVSGLVFERHTWRVLMLLACVVVFEIMWLILSGKFSVEWGTSEYANYKFIRKAVGIASAIALVGISFKIRKTED